MNIDNGCIIVYIGTKNYLNFTCARAIIRASIIQIGENTEAHVVPEPEGELYNDRTMRLMKFLCSTDYIYFVSGDTKVTKMYDEATNRPGSVDMDAALVIKNRINAMPGDGKCDEIVAVDISNLEHEADLQGRGIEIKELYDNLTLIIDQIKEIFRRRRRRI